MANPILLKKTAILGLTAFSAFFALSGCQTAGIHSKDSRAPASGHHALDGSSSGKGHAGSCTVCQENVTDQEIVEHQAYVCSNRHCIDRTCLADQISSIANVEAI